ncbi:DUF1772 domain-containing protein [Mycolicibacter sp. MYC123]|uniref:DUF1772 domain-containing protein n=1 Tax=[Mycobacterium] zoologicum TaxID=2872311 RepID=A0ABU5YGU5_9MYCO|nr:DUF1772 domain-containing protein [Mycolicibacter sp. MYC123]MEB3049266.1 DUF1772 domain-containing protein [Mycolicibacter sp. MYC123]
MTQIVEILAIVLVGTLVGSEFSVVAFVAPVVGRLPDEAFRAFRSDGGGLLGRVMPFWYLVSLALLVATVAVAGPQRGLIGASAGLLAGAVVLSVAVLVPINKRIMAWRSVDDVSRELAARWDRLHWLRVALLAAAFVLLVVGVLR